MVNILLQFKGLKICKNIIVRNFHAINISLHFIKQMKTVTIYKLKKNSNIFFHVLRSFVSLDNQNKSGNSNHSLTHALTGRISSENLSVADLRVDGCNTYQQS